MEISDLDAVDRVANATTDFNTAESERVRNAAFAEHVEASLDAIQVMTDSEDLSTKCLFFGGQSPDGKFGQVTLSGLGETEDGNKR